MVSPTVLSIEDSDAEYFLLEMALQDCRTDLHLLRAVDGEAAVVLLNEGIQIPEGLPHLVLLDINMPKKGGFEVLEFIRAQAFLNEVPVVMFSSSSSSGDRKRALASGADDFVTKPLHLVQMIDVLSGICAKYLQKSRHAAEIQ